jgi:membrane protein required for colicin V production
LAHDGIGGTMNLTDYLIIGLMLASCIAGIMRGLLRELVSLVTWVLAVFLAWRFAGMLAPHLGGALASREVSLWAARALIFLAVLLVGTAVGALLDHFVRLSIFSGADRMLGLIFGALRAAVALGLVAIGCQALRVDDESWYRHSLLVPYAARIGTILRQIGGEDAPAAVTGKSVQTLRVVHPGKES